LGETLQTRTPRAPTKREVKNRRGVHKDRNGKPGEKKVKPLEVWFKSHGDEGGTSAPK